MLKYPVVLTPDSNGQWLVTFPDVPEAVTAGDNEAQALTMAADALESALDFYFDDKRPVPSPSKPKRGQPSVSLSGTAAAKALLHNEMLTQGVKKSELARRMHMAPPNVERIFHAKHVTRFETLEAAFAALGKKLDISVG